MEREEYWFILCNIEGIYNNQIKILMDEFESVEEIFKTSDKTLERVLGLYPRDFNRNALYRLIKERRDTSVLNKIEKWEKQGIAFISVDNPLFPEKMKLLPACPYALYVKGRLPDKDEPLLGMVGARACSEYGRKAAVKIGREAAEGGVSVVSGMARGIDSISAKGALSAGGRTYAVLGCGVDVIYPPENIELYYSIVMSGGIISEYKPGTQPLGWQFPCRNRIISGLSDILLVIEAGKSSGTLSTARHALEQNKDIYAVPGRISDPMSAGCNSLIADGAGIYQNTAYIISQLHMMHEKTYFGQFESESLKNSFISEVIPVTVQNNKEWYSVYQLIASEPVSCGEIIKKCGLKPECVFRVLSELDINGFIREVSKDVYVRSDFS